MRSSWCVAALALTVAAGGARAQTAEIVARSSTRRASRSPTPSWLRCRPMAACACPAKPRDNVVDQVDKQFVPKVQAVLVGTPVTFPNNDNVRHQVYSFSPAKRFELPLYAGVPAQPIVFDKPGVVVLGCNIHDWMVGYIYVSESPYFAKTGKDGKAVLADLPPRSLRRSRLASAIRRVRRVDAPDRRRDSGACRRRRMDAEAQAGSRDAARAGSGSRRAILNRVPPLSAGHGQRTVKRPTGIRPARAT